jgi:DNA-binding protein HU-beta
MAGKNEIVNHLADNVGLTKKQAGEAFDAAFEFIGSALAGGDRVQVPGFGTFLVAERKERQGRNPQTKEPMTIPAGKIVRFKPGKTLREGVNE